MRVLLIALPCSRAAEVLATGESSRERHEVEGGSPYKEAMSVGKGLVFAVERYEMSNERKEGAAESGGC